MSSSGDLEPHPRRGTFQHRDAVHKESRAVATAAVAVRIHSLEGL